MAYLSAGIYVKEVDNSAIVPTVSNSVAFFAGNFETGPIENLFLITNKSELEQYFGKANDTNYNEWFQCSKFLDYSNQLVISRAYKDGKGTAKANGIKIDAVYTIGSTIINELDDIKNLYVGTRVTFDGQNNGASYEKYEIITIDKNSSGKYSIEVNWVDPNTDEVQSSQGIKYQIPSGSDIYVYEKHQNAGADAYQNIESYLINNTEVKPQFNQKYDLYKNFEDFEYKSDLISFDDGVKLKFIAKSAGKILEGVEIAIVNPYDFTDYYDPYRNYIGNTKCEPFSGVSVLDFFEYRPVNDEVGIIIKKGDVFETFVVSFDPSALDGNNKSKYIENVINQNSKFVNVVDNKALGKFTYSLRVEKYNPATGNTDLETMEFETYINSFIFRDSQGSTKAVPLPSGIPNPVYDPLVTYGGESPICGVTEIYNAYFEAEDKEVYELDVIIGNEIDEGASAVSLAESRKDCIAFIGARYVDVVGKKSSIVVDNLIKYVKNNNIERTMYAAFFGNYERIYDNFSKKYRWINVAGDMAGLRTNTNTANATWWASAGLKRGVIKNIDKIAFSPNQPQRDQLYKNNINPIVSFPGEGNLCLGQKTLINYSSSFDRINVRGLFNTIERAMSKAAKSQLFEFNDPFTRNAILAMFRPYLSSVKAGRGIEDFLVICDESNNTPDVISRNELVVDIYIKPNYSAEFIQLTFNNIGTRSFASILGA